MAEERIAVVGAGLAGSLLAARLGDAGYRVDVYEMREDPRSGVIPRGRSINLAISARGIAALATVGLDKVVLDAAVPMKGRMIHSPSGNLSFQPYDRLGQAINSVSRGDLNIALIEAADRHSTVEFHFSHKLISADLDTLALEFSAGDRSHVVEPNVVIGADGSYSAVRWPMLRTDRFSFRQDYLDHGYKELRIPAGPDGDFLLEPNALHIWPRGGHMMIALPNRDGSFTCTLFWPFQGEPGLDNLTDPGEVRDYFEKHFGDAVPVMPTLVDDYLNNPNGSLATFRCWPWHVGRTVLVGDAAHGIVPFYGQGANASFEDCLELCDCLEERAGDWSAAFRDYEERRKPHAEAIADLALANFVEMRDSVGSVFFRMRKKLEKAIQSVVPFWYTPLYTMISFSTIPYADAVAKSRRQDRVIRGVVYLLAIVIVAILISLFTI